MAIVAREPLVPRPVPVIPPITHGHARDRALEAPSVISEAHASAWGLFPERRERESARRGGVAHDELDQIAVHERFAEYVLDPEFTSLRQEVGIPAALQQCKPCFGMSLPQQQEQIETGAIRKLGLADDAGDWLVIEITQERGRSRVRGDRVVVECEHLRFDAHGSFESAGSGSSMGIPSASAARALEPLPTAGTLQELERAIILRVLE